MVAPARIARAALMPWVRGRALVMGCTQPGKRLVGTFAPVSRSMVTSATLLSAVVLLPRSPMAPIQRPRAAHERVEAMIAMEIPGIALADGWKLSKAVLAARQKAATANPFAIVGRALPRKSASLLAGGERSPPGVCVR